MPPPPISERDVQRAPPAAEHYRSLVRAAHDAIVSTDIEGHVRTWNPGAERLYGYSRDEVADRSVSVLVPPDRRDPEQELVDRVVAGDVVHGHETVRVRKDGTRVTVALTLFPVRDARGRVRGIGSVSRDVTRQKEMQAALRRKNRALSEFTAIVAHDLGAPLRQMDVLASVLEEDYGPDLDADARKLTAGIRDGVARMRALMDASLRLSSVEREGRAFRRVDAREPCTEAVETLHPTIEAADATVRVDPLPVIHADPPQIRQLFQNLIQNAVKYRSDAPPRVHVSAERSGDQWVFNIADNGRGIAPEDRERIFRIFERAGPKEGTEGSGIGLAVAKRIVERHGGDIWAAEKGSGGSTGSGGGRGTVIRFTLPAAREDALDEDEE